MQIKSYPSVQTARNLPAEPTAGSGDRPRRGMKTATTTNASDEECVKDCRRTIASVPATVSLRPRAGETFRASTVHEEGDVEIHITGQNLKTKVAFYDGFRIFTKIHRVKIRHKKQGASLQNRREAPSRSEAVRTAVQGFADLCLATRPSDQIADLSSFGTSRIANISKLRTLLPTLTCRQLRTNKIGFEIANIQTFLIFYKTYRGTFGFH